MLAGFCNICGKKMKKVLQFSKEGEFTFFLCQECNQQTQPKRMLYTQNNKESKNRGGNK